MNITREELYKKMDSLPEALQNTIYSEETLDALRGIADANHLSDDKFSKLAATTAFLVAGFVHPEDFAKELTNSLGIDRRVIEGIEKEVRIKILYPIAEDLKTTHGFHIEGAPAAASKLTIQPTQQTETLPVSPVAGATTIPLISVTQPAQHEEVVLKPHVQKEEPSMEPLVSPLVLHEHEDIETARGTINYTESFARPSFHASGDYGTRTEEYVEPAPTARLELGAQVEPGAYIEPKAAKIGKEEAKIIHYSTPDAQTDPFSGAPKLSAKPAQEPAPQTPKPNVSPDNVVNLKDLPK